MPVLIPADHVIEDGIHVLAQKILIVILYVEGLLIGRVCLLGMLLDFKLDFQVFFIIAVATVLGDAGRDTVHPL